jgi:hypothetical protein
MRISFTSKYRYGDEVVLKTSPDVKYIVTGYLLRKKNVTYGLTRDEEEVWHEEAMIQPLKKLCVKGFIGK